MKKCKICGRPIRTGRKYCYTCRSLQHIKEREKKPHEYDIKKMAIIIYVCICGFILSFFIKGDFAFLIRIFSIIFGFPVLIGLLVEYLTLNRKKEKKIKYYGESTIQLDDFLKVVRKHCFF